MTDWMFNHLGGIVMIAVIGGAVVYMIRVSFVSQRRNQASRCARCGEDLGDNPQGVSQLISTQLVMCSDCGRRTRRNQKRACCAFIGMFVVFLALVTLGTVLDWRTGHVPGWEEIKIFAVPMIVFVALLVAVRKVVRASSGQGPG